MQTLFLQINCNLMYLYWVVTICLLLDIKLSEHSKKRNAFLLLILMTCLLENIIIWQIGFTNFVLISTLVMALPTVLAFSFVTPHRGAKLLFVFLTTFIWVKPTLQAANLLAMFFDYSEAVKLGVYIVVMPLLYWLIQRFFKPIYNYMLSNIDQGWATFSMIPALCLALSFLDQTFAIHMGRASFYNTQLWRHIINLLIFMVNLMVLFSFKQIKEQLTIRSELDLYKYQLSGASGYIDQLKQSISQTAIHQHDLRHHLQLINSLALNNNTQAIQAYIQQLQMNIDSSAVKTFSNNETVNLILTAYDLKAQQAEISLAVKTNLSTVLPIPINDLCVLLSNALENAVRATKTVTTSKKEIRVVMQHKNEQLFIEISNPYEGDIIFEQNLPVSTRENGGIGTRSIAQIVKVHAGMYDFNAAEGCFTLRVII